MKITQKQTDLFNNYSDLLNFKELCEALNIGKNTAYRLLNENKILSLKLGREYRIPKIYVIKFIQSEVNKGTQNK
ncbi:helix-turn-helix domain-containing protein [Carnobacterium maltaromaticum]|uniref:helix-turn-helix domain-containing protein n=1 Tax=Carnobacterium maltaromaticum TaxID=2751 RepID=UPI00165A3CE9|nr:helix-turn-helix domain-containing protein [Carnobacterium maltaromaticum]MBC9810719.1 helix-turn-helix domain-containing protein [Carnobacterium maltaromaticum]